MTRIRILACAVLMVLVSAVAARAQQGTSDMTGRAMDDQGAALPGVAIVATNEGSGVFRETITSGDGRYVLSQLVPGRYKLVARLTGFRTYERLGLVLAVGTTMTVDLTLGIGALEESVTVTVIPAVMTCWSAFTQEAASSGGNRTWSSWPMTSSTDFPMNWANAELASR